MDRHLRDRLLAWLAPALLVAVALTQMVFSVGGDLTAWKGGGFGMFATADTASTRHIHATLTTDTGARHTFDLQTDGRRGRLDTSRHLYEHTRIHPTDTRLEELAEAIAANHWTLDDDGHLALVRNPGLPDAPEPYELAGQLELTVVGVDNQAHHATPALVPVELATHTLLLDDTGSRATEDTPASRTPADSRRQARR